MLFQKYNEHAEPLFKQLNILDFDKLITIGTFMWQIKAMLFLKPYPSYLKENIERLGR